MKLPRSFYNKVEADLADRDPDLGRWLEALDDMKWCMRYANLAMFIYGIGIYFMFQDRWTPFFVCAGGAAFCFWNSHQLRKNAQENYPEGFKKND